MDRPDLRFVLTGFACPRPGREAKPRQGQTCEARIDGISPRGQDNRRAEAQYEPG